MSLLIKLISIAYLIIKIQSLELILESDKSELFRKIPKNQRRVNKDNLVKVRALFKKLTKNMQPREIKQWLRQDGEEEMLVTREPMEERGMDITVDQQASLIEKELQSALKYQKSALLDRPYVEKSGKNDFLVMRPELVDPFVTVIPNAIYYNIEKKCVNWLDDCSLKGIRAKLLTGVQSPFK